jgi:hypothetical protein
MDSQTKREIWFHTIGTIITVSFVISALCSSSSAPFVSAAAITVMGDPVAAWWPGRRSLASSYIQRSAAPKHGEPDHRHHCEKQLNPIHGK